jgi:hypothetical protein
MGHSCFAKSACAGVARVGRAAAVLVLLLCCALPAQAGSVSGRVTIEGREFPAGGVLTLTDEGGSRIEVGTDSGGDFSIVLPPGTYTVTYREWTAKLRAYPGPVRQDIKLRKGR